MILAVFFDLKIIMQTHKAICAFLFLGMVDTVMIIKLYKFIKRNMLYVLAFYIETVDAFLMRSMITFSFDIFFNVFFLFIWLTQRTVTVFAMVTLLLVFFWIFLVFGIQTIETLLMRSMVAFLVSQIFLLSLRRCFDFN